jgi:hypothetical protein
VTLEPDALRDAIYGDGYRGYTYLNDLAGYVRGVWGWGAEVMRIDDVAEVQALLLETLRRQGFTIVRTREPLGFYHFTVITGGTEGEVIRHNPLGGQREALTWREFASLYAGWLLVLTP